MADLKELEEKYKISKRLLVFEEAKDDLLKFTKITMPDPEDHLNPDKSKYQEAKHHIALANALERVEKHDITRLIVTMPPRAGKSELISKRFMAWFSGRSPSSQMMFGTYNDDMAADVGKDVRDIFNSLEFQSVFPKFELAKGGKSANEMRTTSKGKIVLKGRGGSLTGKGADLFVIDDPIKDAKEARSDTIRNDIWDWFNKVCMTRLMPGAVVIIVMTRWHEDDLIGRLIDPENEKFNEEEAKKWKIIELPIYARENDPLGRKVGENLWPERFTDEFIQSQKNRDMDNYNSLYMCSPSSEEGSFFKRDDFKFYSPLDLANAGELKYFCSGDWALTEDEKNDPSCVIIAAADSDDNIYIVDCAWERVELDVSVDRVFELYDKYEFNYLWGEKGQINSSMKPFLVKRMIEENKYFTLDPYARTSDKKEMAQSIKARMSVGKVWFPIGKWFTKPGMAEMLKFPFGNHDDWVDAMAGFGVKLLQITKPKTAEKAKYKVGSIEWIKADSKYREERKKLEERMRND